MQRLESRAFCPLLPPSEPPLCRERFFATGFVTSADVFRKCSTPWIGIRRAKTHRFVTGGASSLLDRCVATTAEEEEERRAAEEPLGRTAEAGRPVTEAVRSMASAI